MQMAVAIEGSEKFGMELSAIRVELHAHCNSKTLRRLKPWLKAALRDQAGHCLIVAQGAR